MNIIVHRNSYLSSTVHLSITIAKELRADPWSNPTPTLNPSVTPTAHFTTVLLWLPCAVSQFLTWHPIICAIDSDHLYTSQIHIRSIYHCLSGFRGSSLSRDIQTFRFPATSSSTFRGTQRHFWASWKHILGVSQVLFLERTRLEHLKYSEVPRKLRVPNGQLLIPSLSPDTHRRRLISNACIHNRILSDTTARWV